MIDKTKDSLVTFCSPRAGRAHPPRLMLFAAMFIGVLNLSPVIAEETFLQFPLTEQIAGAAKTDAVLWTVRAGAQTSLQFAVAPKFAAITLITKSDEDGQPIAAITLSPDGRFAVYQTAIAVAGENSYNPAGLIDRPRPALWLVATRPGAAARALGPGIGAQFLPDGRLMYRHDGDLHIVAVNDEGHSTDVVVKGGARFENIAWLPDNASFVFAEDRGGYSLIGLYRLGADRVEWLVSAPDRLTSLAISPDGRRAAYRRFPGREHSRTYDQTEYEPFSLETVDLASRETRVWWRTEAPAASIIDDTAGLRWLGNDRVLFGSEHDGWERLYVAGVDARALRALSPPNCEVADSELFAPATLVMVDNCADLDTRRLSVVDASTGREKAIPVDDPVLASPTRVGERFLAYVGATADSPPLLRIWDLRDGKMVFKQRANDFGWRPHFTAPAPTSVRLELGGVSVHAQLFLPKRHGRHPALVYVHGGPQRQMFPAFHFMPYYANNYAMNRQFAERGYVVLSVNYRSGSGYGHAYREPAGRAWRGASEYADVLAAARYLTARPEVDPARLGIWGGSYGGLLTGQALARDSALFKAGVAVHGVYDWSWPTSKAAHLNPSVFFGVDPQDRPQALRASPLGALEGWRSPVLLFSGDEDANVDVLETVDLTQRLRERGVEVRTVIVPGEAHDFVRHSTWRLLWQQASAFFDSKLL